MRALAIVELDGGGAHVRSTWELWPEKEFTTGGALRLAVSGDTLGMTFFDRNDAGYLLRAGFFDLKRWSVLREPETIPTSTGDGGNPHLTPVTNLAPIDGGWLVSWVEYDGAASVRARLFTRRLSPSGTPLGEPREIVEARDWPSGAAATSDGKRALWLLEEKEEDRRFRLLFSDGEHVTMGPAPTGAVDVAAIHGNLVTLGDGAWLLDADGAVRSGPVEGTFTSAGALGSGYVVFSQAETGQHLAQALDRDFAELGQARVVDTSEVSRSVTSAGSSTLALFWDLSLEVTALTCTP
jgi:hypothetical protein